MISWLFTNSWDSLDPTLDRFSSVIEIMSLPIRIAMHFSTSVANLYWGPDHTWTKSKIFCLLFNWSCPISPQLYATLSPTRMFPGFFQGAGGGWEDEEQVRAMTLLDARPVLVLCLYRSLCGGERYTIHVSKWLPNFFADTKILKNSKRPGFSFLKSQNLDYQNNIMWKLSWSVSLARTVMFSFAFQNYHV